MRANEFSDDVLRTKQARFLAAVRRAAKHIGQAAPEVKFWADKCPSDSGHELAHIHPDTGVICVTNKRLEEMSYEDIEETATHEVTHLIDKKDESNPVHSGEFYAKHDEVKLHSWRPPLGAGIIMIDPRNKTPISKTRTKAKSGPDKVQCNYHFCRKKVPLKQCPFCKDYYCQEHLKPKRPGFANFDSDSVEDRLRRQTVGGHPCPDYADHETAQEEQQKTRYHSALANVLSDRPAAAVFSSGPVDDDYVPRQKSEKKHVVVSPQELLHKHKTVVYEVPAEHRVEPIPAAQTPVSKPKGRIIAAVVIFVLIALIIMAYFMTRNVLVSQNLTNPNVSNTSLAAPPEPKVVERQVPVLLSIAVYTSNPKSYTFTDVSLEGYLLRGVAAGSGNGVYEDFVIDDYDNRIRLLNLTPDQRLLFNKTASAVPYTVSGTFKAYATGPVIIVSSVTASERRYRVEKVVLD